MAYMGEGCFNFSLEASLSRRYGGRARRTEELNSLSLHKVSTRRPCSVFQMKKEKLDFYLKVTKTDPIFHLILFDSVPFCSLLTSFSPWNPAFLTPDILRDPWHSQSSLSHLTHQLAGPLSLWKGP